MAKTTQDLQKKFKFDPLHFRYKDFIEDNFKIVDKLGNIIPLKLNKPQLQYMLFDRTNKDDILKSRQFGFSTLIDAIWTTDFIMRPNSYNVIVADIEENATGLLDRVKLFIESYQEVNNIKIPLKYNSRFELYNNFMNSRFVIGTAKNAEFGRSKTITNLHLSELAFYPNIERIIASAGQAVVESGRIVCETTANGFNEYSKFREADNGFKKLFYAASKFYTKEFLDEKKKQLGRLYKQEYPENEIEAFITSGDQYFNRDSLEYYLKNVRKI